MSYSLAFMSTEEEFVDPSQTFYDNTFFDSPPEQLSSLASIENSGLPVRSTHVDILMRIIKPTQQADQESYQSALHPSTTSLRLPAIPRDHKSRKRYRCSTTGCDKAFCRKAYLEIHSRVHTGVKPFSARSRLAVNASVSRVTAKPMKEDTRVNDRITAIFVASPLDNMETCEHTRSFIRLSSLTHASWTIVESTSLN